MKKFLCTASLILAFSMSSFANTNELEDVNATEAKTFESVDLTLKDDPCTTVKVKFVTATGEETPTGAEITLTVHTVYLTVCEDGTVTIAE